MSESQGSLQCRALEVQGTLRRMTPSSTGMLGLLRGQGKFPIQRPGEHTLLNGTWSKLGSKQVANQSSPFFFF